MADEQVQATMANEQFYGSLDKNTRTYLKLTGWDIEILAGIRDLALLKQVHIEGLQDMLANQADAATSLQLAYFSTASMPTVQNTLRKTAYDLLETDVKAASAMSVANMRAASALPKLATLYAALTKKAMSNAMVRGGTHGHACTLRGALVACCKGHGLRASRMPVPCACREGSTSCPRMPPPPKCRSMRCWRRTPAS